jgi:tetratricopeptide (TPR) repeat protein
VLLNHVRSIRHTNHAISLLAAAWLVGIVLATGPGCQMAATGYNMEGVRLQQQGNYQAALAKFEKARKNDPRNADTYYNIGATYQQMGKVNNDPAMLAQAESLYHQCLDQDDNHVDCRRGLAALLVETGRSDKAFTMLQRWVQSAPQLADSHIELARLYEEFGENQLAQQQLHEAIALSPNHWRALASLGRLREQDGDYAQALANYQRAYAANSFQPGVAARIAALQQGVTGGATTADGTRIVTQPPGTPRY